MTGKTLDLICLGRSSVDLYGEQIGGPLEDVRGFAKYVGGCPTNIAVGTARLGLKSALITRVGDEQMGRFIRQTLVAEGVDVRQVSTDPDRLTALVILGIRDRQTFPHIFYRTDCADMGLRAEHIDQDIVTTAKAILITGTHLSASGVEEATKVAVTLARNANSKVILDIDYRPVAWGVAGHGDGENRYVAAQRPTEVIGSMLPLCDLVVGTEEEVRIAGGHEDILMSLRGIRARTEAQIVLKRGAEGCIVFDGPIPDSIDDGLHARTFAVPVLNNLGAGDGFLSGFLSGWLREAPLAECARYGNACGAIVVSRHGCAPAMPTSRELMAFLDNGCSLAALERIHRVTTRGRSPDEVCALAFDHRSQFSDLAPTADAKRIARFKRLIATAAERVASADPAANGMIVDDVYGADVLSEFAARKDFWIARPVEEPGSRPLQFAGGPDIGTTLRTWPTGQVAKCLVFYHPDDPADLRREQLASLALLASACEASGHELLLELIPPAAAPNDDLTVSRALAQIYDHGIHPDWWKLPPCADPRAWENIGDEISRADPDCRGILLLGLEASPDKLNASFNAVSNVSQCRGFAVGRTIFAEAAADWFSGSKTDEQAIEMIAANYQTVLNLWRSRGACVANLTGTVSSDPGEAARSENNRTHSDDRPRALA